MNPLKYFYLFLSSCLAQQKHVLIIGDSISRGYAEYIPNAQRISGNAMDTQHTLDLVDEYLKPRAYWDLVIWNNGIWDLAMGVSKAQYKKNLEKIGLILSENSSKVVFLTTTPLKKKNQDDVDPILVDKYNEIANDLFEKNPCVKVYDLNSWAKDQMQLMGKDGTHWSDEGYKYLARYVNGVIENELR